MGIPKELQELKQWTYSFASDDLKRPKHSHYTPNGSLAFPQAVTMARQLKVSFGFYTTDKDPYVIGDIDHMEDVTKPELLPLHLADILTNWGVYSEVSPSGEGIRWVCKLPSSGEKSRLTGAYYHTRYPLKEKREAQVNVGTPWLRFTGNETSYSSGKIPVVTLEKLDEAFTLKWAGEDDESELQNSVIKPVDSNEKVPRLQELFLAIDHIPLDQNPRIQRAYHKIFRESYTHYNFWLKVLMGMHDYAAKTGTNMDCLQKAVEWSQTDADAYTGDKAVMDTWNSLSDRKEKISFHTVFALAFNHKLVWPRPKPLTKQQEKQAMDPQPMNSEFANFKKLVNHYDIQLHRDAHAPNKMYISADPDIMAMYLESFRTKYYYEEFRGIYDEKNLVAGMHIMSQDMGFVGLTHMQTGQHIKDWMFQIRNEIDLVKRYFDTPVNELPEDYKKNSEFYEASTVESMFDCLDLEYLTTDTKKEQRLYYKYYKAWLMGFVRNLYWPHDPHMNNCVLLLSGREQIRKTSHFRYMLPEFMRDDRIAFTTHGFDTEGAMRDNIKLAAGNSLMVWDEIEQYLDSKTEKSFKKLIDSNPTKFIDKYETIEASYKPIAMYGATSNEREFKLSDTGSRRLFHIPVKWVDTDRLDRIFWWRIVNDLKAEIKAWIDTGKGDPPWLLTKDELEFQATLHGKVTAKSSLEIIVREIWNFNEECFLPEGDKKIDTDCGPLKDPRFLSTKGVIDRINLHTNGNQNINRAQLTRILHNVCGRWTGTTNKRRSYSMPRLQVFRGLGTYSGQHKLWIMPIPSNPYED